MKKSTSLNVTGLTTAILTLDETEGAYIDISETRFRVIREDGEVNLVEIGGSGGRVIARAAAGDAPMPR